MHGPQGHWLSGVSWDVGVSGGIECGSSVGGVRGPAGDVEGIGGPVGVVGGIRGWQGDFRGCRQLMGIMGCRGFRAIGVAVV